MTTINIQKEIQKAMLDDEFVRVFASKFRTAMIDMENQAQPEDPVRVDVGDCDISLNVAEDDPLAFGVYVDDFLTSRPLVSVKNRDDDKELMLASRHYLQVLAILKESGFNQNSGFFLGGFIVKEEATNG